jgi:membrane protein DedA with SNARE-associated domain
MTGSKTRERRSVLLGLAAARGVLSLVAIPLAPALFRDHFVVLVLLRPTKEVLLAGGFLFREGEVRLWQILPATIPIAFLGVWLFFLLGRAYAEEIQSDEGLPKWARKVLPPERVKRMCGLLERKGAGLIVGGRLAAFPSTVLAAAAGASGMEPRKFLPADALGGALSVAEVVIAGYALGAAYKRAGPWLTALGVAVLLGLLFVVGRWLKRDGQEPRPD